MSANQGVGILQAYAGTFADLGSGGTNLSGSHVVPLVQVAFGATLGPGEYSIDPTNAYHFSPADVGQTVTINYSYALNIIKQQQKDLIPSTLSIQVGGTLPFSADGGVSFYTGLNDGHAFTRVSGTPTASGTYSVSGSAPATYHFAAADIAKEILITFKLDNTSTLPNGTAWSVIFTLFTGEHGQAAWSLLESNFPGAALGYTGIAYAAYGPMDLGYGAQIQQNIYEVLTADAWGGGITDCNPVQCILRVLTDKVWGLGKGTVPFPVSAIDIASFGAPKATGAAIQDSTASSWFAANGFFISPVIDKQDTAASLMSRWLEAGQCAAFMSEGLLKLVSYGDTSTAGNGAIWVAPSSFAVALDDTCFLPKGAGEDPVKISTPTDYMSAWNTVQVSWNNRANQYAPEITPESDPASINRYGERIEDPQTWDFITTLPSAVFAASMRVKRNAYARNQYEFSLPYRYSYLEPMDVVPITTSSVWAAETNNQNLAVVNLPVRITRVVDNPDGTLEITAEDYPFGVHQPTVYNKALAAAVAQPNKYADPGNSEVVLFEATSRLTGFAGNQIWIGALGANSDWGSCNVYASMDGDKYLQIGTIESAARLGVLGAAFASGAATDTTNTLIVDLVQNSGALDSGTTADADADNTLCFVDGELISYSACAVTGVDRCTAGTYIRRGRMGSAIAGHAAGTLFMRLDNTVFKFTYDPSWAGKTIHLKFQSVNVYGNSAQDLSTLTAVSFTIPGLNPGTVDAASGLVTSGYMPPNVTTNVALNAVVTSAYDSVSGTSSISVYGPGGVGTGWTYTVGSKTRTYAAGTITGVAPGSRAYVVYDTQTNAYVLVPATNYGSLLNDFYIVLGGITAAGTTGGGTTGGYTGGTGGGGGTAACTVEGTPLDTPDGPVDNRTLKARFDVGAPVYLSGRFGPERILSAEWVYADDVYHVAVGNRAAFRCSGTHMLRVQGHYQWTREIAERARIETRDGYEHARITPVPEAVRVLKIHLEGPSHEYSSHGVMTHNIKAEPLF
jgi:hypothetical protein